jgi:hypothetical protein
MELKEAVTFWRNEPSQEVLGDQAVVIDAESVPGWVIALRRPPDRAPYVEIWWEEDFIAETQAHQTSAPK